MPFEAQDRPALPVEKYENREAFQIGNVGGGYTVRAVPGRRTPYRSDLHSTCKQL
jgi:hypothetical protein